MEPLYESDFNEWLDTQIKLIKSKDFEKLDIEHLIEEMEDLGDSFKEAIESHLTIILMHKLKQLLQPERDGKSWNSSIIEGKFQIEKKVQRHPSLKNYPRKVFLECYEDARRVASRETGLDLRKFPKECPWSLEEVLGE